ncbi:MAG: sigma-70 family RNA polymerase sigma factor [Opitutae bacterium]|nr:sigma-70 family RNA polymerase sigma factor [Opitutae bacterium]
MNHPEPDDFILLQAVGRGDERAFAQLYDRFSGPVFGLTLRILRSRAEAEEILQESFWQVWKHADRFQPALGSPFTWVVTIARRKAIDRLRSNSRHLQRIQEAAVGSAAVDRTEPTGLDNAEAGDTVTAVQQAFAKLRPEERCAIELAFFDGLTHTEIATALGVPEGTVKARIRRGMLKLQRPLAHLHAAGGNRPTSRT